VVGLSIYEHVEIGDTATAAALALPLLPLVVLAGIGGAIVLMRSRHASLAGLEGEVPTFTVTGSSARTNVAAIATTIIAIIPAIVVPIVALAWLTAQSATPAEQTVANGAAKLLRASGFAESLRGAWALARLDALRTIELATLAASMATIVALLLARLLARTRWSLWAGALGAGLAVPAPIVGLGLIELWNRPATDWVYNSALVVVLGWLARFFPLALFLSQSAISRVPIELEDAAALCGRNRRQRLIAVVLPIAAPGLAVAWLAMYVLCATEFGATLLVAPPGAPLLAPSVVNLMRRGQDPEIAACQVLLLVVVALPLVPIVAATLLRADRWLAMRGSAAR
jgi:iron(III) transport system permease protein